MIRMPCGHPLRTYDEGRETGWRILRWRRGAGDMDDLYGILRRLMRAPVQTSLAGLEARVLACIAARPAARVGRKFGVITIATALVIASWEREFPPSPPAPFSVTTRAAVAASTHDPACRRAVSARIRSALCATACFMAAIGTVLVGRSILPSTGQPGADFQDVLHSKLALYASSTRDSNF